MYKNIDNITSKIIRMRSSRKLNRKAVLVIRIRKTHINNLMDPLFCRLI